MMEKCKGKTFLYTFSTQLTTYLQSSLLMLMTMGKLKTFSSHPFFFLENEKKKTIDKILIMFCLSQFPVSLLLSCLFKLSSTHRHYENQEICFGCPPQDHHVPLRPPPSFQVLIILIKMNRIHLMFDFPHVFLGQNYKN